MTDELLEEGEGGGGGREGEEEEERGGGGGGGCRFFSDQSSGLRGSRLGQGHDTWNVNTWKNPEHGEMYRDYLYRAI